MRDPPKCRSSSDPKERARQYLSEFLLRKKIKILKLPLQGRKIFQGKYSARTKSKENCPLTEATRMDTVEDPRFNELPKNPDFKFTKRDASSSSRRAAERYKYANMTDTQEGRK